MFGKKLTPEDFEKARNKMITNDLQGRDIDNDRVLDAFNRVPREKFVLIIDQAKAYNDHPIYIGEGQTISQPYIVALMTQHLDLTGDEKVLEVGTGSGYQTAILAELAKTVYTVERIEDLSERAQDILDDLEYENIEFKIDDGTLGWKENAPYDRIIVTAAAPKIPEPLVEQLAEGGLMVIPVGTSSHQELLVVEKLKGGEIKTWDVCGCIFVKLIGKAGWSE